MQYTASSEFRSVPPNGMWLLGPRHGRRMSVPAKGNLSAIITTYMIYNVSSSCNLLLFCHIMLQSNVLCYGPSLLVSSSRLFFACLFMPVVLYLVISSPIVCLYYITHSMLLWLTRFSLNCTVLHDDVCCYTLSYHTIQYSRIVCCVTWLLLSYVE